MSNTQQQKTRTITLSGRPPVRITEADWPVIARASEHDGGTVESQANRTWDLRVRQHADGRAIVYGVHWTCWQGESGSRGGEMLAAGDDIAAAILRVAETIDSDARLAQECIADLPAEEV